MTRVRMFRGWFLQSKWRPCLRAVPPKSRVLLCFLWAEELIAKDIHKEMFPVYGGKCLSRKAGHTGSREIATLATKVSLMTKSLKRRGESG
jgi:hypothetical protein